MVGRGDDHCDESQGGEHGPHSNEKKGDQYHGIDPDASLNDLPKEDKQTR